MDRRMFCRGAALAAASTLVACAARPAQAHDRGPAGSRVSGRLVEVEVIDRAAGGALPVHLHGGRRYVAGAPGHRYAIAVRNRSGGRVLAVVSVDGVNAVTGETAAWDQNGYVFSPGQRWEIRGWRKSHERVAAFEFTALADSYAARTGRPDHVGVIGVAVFRERPAPEPQVLRGPDTRAEPAEDARAAAESAGSPSAPPGADAGSRSAAARAQRDVEHGRLGTGHGGSEVSRVGTTTFERARSTPDEVIAIHYDSRANLVALGVIVPEPWPVATPFPGNARFVPDPPR
jgi:hypothetical protein